MSAPVWRKSSRSGTGDSGGQDCVELAHLAGDVAVRDNKAPGAGHLALTPRQFTDLVDRAKRDELSA